MSSGEEFHPEAAIVNYYGPSMWIPIPPHLVKYIFNANYIPFSYYLRSGILSGDMLGGHVDDMEADWTRPIVSIRSSLFACFVYYPFIKRLCANSDDSMR